MTNAGVLQAAHIHQSCGSSHNSDKCTLCIHIASVKAISLEFTVHTGFIAAVTERPFIFTSVFVQDVSLASQSPRGPPFIS
jgi:hypothetical protein